MAVPRKQFRVDLVWLGHPRADAIGLAGQGLWLKLGLWCIEKDTEGFVPKATAKALALGSQALVNSLVREGLLIAAGDETGREGYIMHAFHAGEDGVRHETREQAEQRRERARTKKQTQRASTRSVPAVSPPVSPGDRGGDSRGDSAGTASRVDTTSSLEVPPLNPPQGEAPQAATTKAAPRKTRLPASWEPKDRHREKAREHRLNLAAEVVKFRDHHAFRGTLGVDWDRGFDTWLRKAAEFAAAERAADPSQRQSVRDRWKDKS